MHIVNVSAETSVKWIVLQLAKNFKDIHSNTAIKFTDAGNSDLVPLRAASLNNSGLCGSNDLDNKHKIHHLLEKIESLQ